jgi:hypothetical protein
VLQSVFSFISEQDGATSASPPVVDANGSPVLPSISHDEDRDNSMEDTPKSKGPLYAFTSVVGKKASHAFTYVDDARDVSTLLLRMAGLNDSMLSDEAMAGIETDS